LAFKKDFLTPLFLRRLLLYIAGYFVLAFGVAFIVRGNLGTTPVNSIAYTLSIILPADLGFITGLVYGSYVFVQLAILRKEFRPVDFFQIAAAICFGGFVSFWDRILAFTTPDFYLWRLLLVLGGIVITGLGISIYLRANMIPLPPEGLILAIQQKKRKWKLHNIKVFSDCMIVFAAIAVSFIAAGRVVGVREGTIIAMLGIGRSMGFFSALLGKKIDALFRLNAD
jgi:uncharacterized membrane protein YczE